MDVARIILEYIKVIFNWPLVVLILGFAYKRAIGDFFRRLIKGKGYGIELEAATPAEQQKEIEKAKENIPHQLEDDIEKYIREHPKETKDEYLKAVNGYWFERAYNIIYGTQIQLLEHLSKKGDQGDKYVNLASFYGDFLQKSAQKTQMADYLRFLVNMKFIEYKKSETDIVVKITPYGLDFLSYLKTQYPLAYKYKGF